VEWGARTIILCIGGSATCDGGAGLAQALGARFYDSQGLLIGEPVSGGALVRVARVEPPGALPPIRVACDVTNPLLGREGAARVFGPQKGALTEDVELLDRGLAHLAALLRVDSTFAGAGAAGGAGFGLAVLCGARLERGIELVLDAVHFRERSQGARLVLTGEGRLDGQTMRGKAVMGVAAVAHEIGVPVVAIVGSTGPGAEACTDPSRHGLLTGYVSLTERYGPERAMRDTALLVEDVARRVVGSSG
jgi:glycerate kinase